ncbi:MAG: FtsX-like permease family protein [Clostridia bacterium]|nr:FtsX-like permease family protein [Clostridia bacterium]
MKRKKLTINKLAFGNLKARKKQYLLMIIGIILAMVFTSAAMFFAVCNEDSRQERKWISLGKQDFILKKCDGFDLESFKQDGSVIDYATFEVIAYGYSPDDDFEDGMGIAVHNDKSREISHFYFLDGRYPKAENEIAIESDALFRMNLYDAVIGDEITLNLRAANGDGFLEKETQKTYTLVGILKDRRYTYEQWYLLNSNYECPEYPAAIVYDNAEVEIGGRPWMIGLVDFNYDDKTSFEPFYNSYKEYLRQNGLDNYRSKIFPGQNSVNYDGYLDGGYWIQTAGEQVINDWALADMKQITTLGTILAAVLAIASCFGVINAFNTNLQERRKQIGMLRAVGATKRQIIKVFGREALLISLICAPLSVALGYFTVRIFSYLMGEIYIFNPEWYVVIGIGILGICFVMAAALVPLFYAARVTPMQAIRNTELGRKMKNKKIKSVKDFNSQKLIAKRSLVFHRFRQVSVSLILIATIIVSCFCVSLLEYYTEKTEDEYDYRVHSFGSPEYAFANFFYDFDSMLKENDVDDISSNRHVVNATGRLEYAVNWLVDGEYPGFLKLAEFNRAVNYDKYEHGFGEGENLKPEEIVEYYENGPEYSEEYLEFREAVDYEAEPFATKIQTDSEKNILSLDEYILDGEIDIGKLDSGEEVILVVPEEIAYSIKYNSDGSYASYGHDYITDGYYANYRSGYTEILREKMPFKAGENIKLSMLFNYDKKENKILEHEKAYDYEYERYDREVKIGAIISKYPFSGFWNRLPMFLTTNQGISEFDCPLRYEFIDINTVDEMTPEIEEEIEAFFRAAEYEFDSNYRMQELQKTEMKTLVAGISSIILLLFCIAASLVNNALTSKIRESKREIGTLRAVGASAKELTMIYIHQLLSMFGMGCGLGFGIYTVVFFSAKLICKYGVHIMFPFEFRVITAAAICLVLFAICSLNLYSKIKKQMKYSIVENIREL